jgi:putative transposase
VAKKRFSEEQIIGVVKQLEAGRTAAELAREVGVSTWTVYAWKAKYGGMEPSEAARLHHLEDENNRLKRLVADLSLDREMLKALLIKNGLSS